MEDQEVESLAARLAMLEILVQGLYVGLFKRRPNPVAAANKHAELIRQRAAENPPVSHIKDAMLMLEEHMNVFFDSVIDQLRGLK